MVAPCSDVRNKPLPSRLERVVIRLYEHLVRRNGEETGEEILGRAVSPQRQVVFVIDPAVMIGIVVGKSPTVARPGGHGVVLFDNMRVMMVGLVPQTERIHSQGQAYR